MRGRPDARGAKVGKVPGVVLGGLLLAGTAILLLGSLVEESPGDPGAVTPDAVRAALVTSPGRPLTMSDEIDHFRARLAARGEERFSRSRLVSAHLLRFRAYGAPPDLQAAESHLDAAMERAGSSPRLLSLRSSLHLLGHRFPQALAAAQEANRARGDFDSALRLRLFDAMWAYGLREPAVGLLELPHDRKSVDYLVRKARVLDRTGNVEGARNLMEDALGQVRAYAQPPAVEAWALVELGHFEHHGGRPRRAVDRYLDALEVLPGYGAAVEGLAWVAYGVDRDLAAAQELFARALELGGHLDLYAVLADVAEARGLRDRARELRNAFLERATEDPEQARAYWRSLALVLAERPDRVDEAVTYARKDLANRPTSGSWATLAWTLHRAGRGEEACRTARRATGWGAPEPGVQYRAGIIALECGDEERGRNLLEGALAARSELGPATVEVIEARLAELS